MVLYKLKSFITPKAHLLRYMKKMGLLLTNSIFSIGSVLSAMVSMVSYLHRETSPKTSVYVTLPDIVYK